MLGFSSTLPARAAGVVAFVLASAALPQNASACAVCGAADKTLPVRGEEIAFAGRVRATLDGRAAGFAARHVPLRIVEMRLVPGAAVAINEEVLLAADVPVLRRTLETERDTGPVASDRVVVGDAEARASYLAWRSPTRRLSFFGGAKAPTAPLERDATGTPVPTDLQPGCGSIVPMVGATYTITGSLLSMWASSSLLLPVSVRSGPHPGDSLRASVTAQIQPHKSFAMRTALNGRLDAAGDIGGQVDPRSGGASIFVAPELVTSPIEDLVVSVGAAFPLVQETRGHRVTAPIALVGIGWDF